MGTKVSFKATRSSAEAASDITDPTEYFTALFDDDGFQAYQTAFNALPADKQSEFMALFGGEVDMSGPSSGQVWLGDNDGDIEALRTMMQKINALIDTC